jgi:hypothetical protein
MKKAFPSLIGVILLISLFLSITLVSQDASAPQVMPTVTIALEEPSQTAHVGPGDSGEAIFNGVVSVTSNIVTRVVVSLASEDTWGTSVVAPSTLTFTRSGEQYFTVSVLAPLGESCETCGTVTVYGRWAMYPGGLSGPVNPPQGATGRIDIAQYHNLILNSPNSYAQTSRGTRVEFDLFIGNDGNGDDSANLAVNNADELSVNGIQASTNPSTIDIPQYDETHVYVFVNTYSSTVGGTYEVEVEVIPDIRPEEKEVSFFYSFIVDVPYNPYTPSPEPEPEPPTPEPEPEPEPVEPNEPQNEEEGYAQNINEPDEPLMTTEEFFLLVIILFIIAMVAILIIGHLGNRRRARRLRRVYARR